MFGCVFGITLFNANLTLPQYSLATHVIEKLPKNLSTHLPIGNLKLSQYGFYRQRRSSYG